MRSLLLITSLAFASTALGQAPPNYHDHWSDCTNYTSRGTLGVNGGDILVKNPTSPFSGVGHDPSGGATLLSSVCHALQDQNAATLEMYQIIVRGDFGGAPDPSPAGILLQTAPVNSPGGSGTVAWVLTTTLATPSTALPLCAPYYFGANVAANAAWTADGLSFHINTYYLLGTTAADNPAPIGPTNVAWNIVGGTPSQPATPRGIRLGLGVASSLLKLGNTDPTLIGNAANCVSTLLNANGIPRSFGVGGMWPRKGGGRDDGLDCRVRDAANPGGVFVTFLGTTLGCPGLPLGGLANGALYLNPGGPFLSVATGGLDANGIGSATILSPGQAPSEIIGLFVDFQAFSIGPTLTLPGNLSNRASVNYLP